MTHGVGLPFIDPGASWTDPQDGDGLVYLPQITGNELGTFTWSMATPMGEAMWVFRLSVPWWWRI